MFNVGDDHGYNYCLITKIEVGNAEAPVGDRQYLVSDRSLVSRRTPSS